MTGHSLGTAWPELATLAATGDAGENTVSASPSYR